MKKRVYINSSLNIAAFKQNDDERLTREWIDYRINIFMNYTLKSLKSQTSQDFIATIRYEESTESIVREALDRYEKLPENVKFIRKDDFSTTITNELKDYDYLYLVRLDSDDMYHKSYVKKLHDYQPKENTLSLINQTGYLYDSVNNLVVEYYHPSPAFFTLIYKTEDYLSGKRHILDGGAPGAVKLTNEIMPGRNFTVM